MSDQPNRRPVVVLMILALVAGVGFLFCAVGAPFALIAVQAVRESARREQAAKNLTQIGQALRNYHARYAASEVTKPQAMELYDILSVIQSKQFVDLTHAFEPGIPHWPGFPDEQLETLYSYEEGGGTMGSGFFAQRFSLVGQWGTHCDAPVHFVKGKRTIDEIGVKEMVLPLVVIDVHEKVRDDPDYTITMEDIRSWESDNGLIPKGAFVAMRTDWSKRWPDAKAMRNEDKNGVAHYPGWSLDVLKFLYEERGITASGHETTDTDPGIATSKDDYSLETYILGTNHYQIELLANLDQVPEFGAVAVVTFPKPKGGSGFPARVFAILP